MVRALFCGVLTGSVLQGGGPGEGDAGGEGAGQAGAPRDHPLLQRLAGDPPRGLAGGERPALAGRQVPPPPPPPTLTPYLFTPPSSTPSLTPSPQRRSIPWTPPLSPHATHLISRRPRDLVTRATFQELVSWQTMGPKVVSAVLYIQSHRPVWGGVPGNRVTRWHRWTGAGHR